MSIQMALGQKKKKRHKEKSAVTSRMACKFLFMAGRVWDSLMATIWLVVQHLHIMTRTLVRIRFVLRLTHLQFVALPGHNSTGFLGKSINPSDG